MYTIPPSVFGIGERAYVRALSQKRLAIRSARAILLRVVDHVSSGNPARHMGTLTLMRECPALSFWTSSTRSSKASVVKKLVMPLYLANGFPSALRSVL